jgi:hypothetical protein
MMDESRCQSLVHAQLGESARHLAFQQGAQQKDQHIAPGIIVGFEIADAPVRAVVSWKEAAGDIRDRRGLRRPGMDVHLPLQKEALVLEYPAGLAQSFLNKQREILARIADQFPDDATHARSVP